MSTITVRRLDSNGDYTFGQGLADYISDTEAVAQIIKTRLLLFVGEWWLNLNDGLPLWQSILSASGANVQSITLLIQDRILGTPNVVDITSLSTNFDSIQRAYSFTASVTTTFSTSITISNIPVNLPAIT
jgi:hypothetical protein